MPIVKVNKHGSQEWNFMLCTYKSLPVGAWFKWRDSWNDGQFARITDGYNTGVKLSERAWFCVDESKVVRISNLNPERLLYCLKTPREIEVVPECSNLDKYPPRLQKLMSQKI